MMAFILIHPLNPVVYRRAKYVEPIMLPSVSAPHFTTSAAHLICGQDRQEDRQKEKGWLMLPKVISK